MLFNSFDFWIFFVLVYALYWLLSRRAQNLFLLAASYFFYAFWDYRFLSLLLAATCIDFLSARMISRSTSPRVRRGFLIVSMCSNLGILGFFKYYGFFVSNMNVALTRLGFSAHLPVLRVILPIGISFYTFQSMSYVIDVYLGELAANTHFLDFALCVSFFPHLVAGPIVRGSYLLPQVQSPRKFDLDQIYQGFFLAFFGLFKKVVLADNLAKWVDPVFANSSGHYQGVPVILATYAFAFQIYCDFSGYTDIARGLAKMLGFELLLNFNLPFFATDPADFWRRWHISLTTWFRDYLYIPLAMWKGDNLALQVLFILFVFMVSGLWHGAAWHFVLWGAYHGVLLICHRGIRMSPWYEKFRLGVRAPVWKFLSMVIFFQFMAFGFLLFRASSVDQILQMSHAAFGHLLWSGEAVTMLKAVLPCFGVLMVLEIPQYLKKDLMAIYHFPVVLRGLVYASISILILLYGVTGGGEFIYFQF